MINDIKVIDNKSDLISLLNELADSGHYIFRGYSKQDQLQPNIMRNNLVDQEKTLLFEFERSANQYLNTSNPIDFMSYAQHYGLSTRLLDFTYNPFIALYFSLFTPKGNSYKNSEDKEYYYIRYCDIEKNIIVQHVPIFNRGDFFEINSMAKRCVELIETVDMMFNPNHLFGEADIFQNRDSVIKGFFSTIAKRTMDVDIDSFVKDNSRKIYDRRLLFIDPNQSNQRLVMQQGLFLVPLYLYFLLYRFFLNLLLTFFPPEILLSRKLNKKVINLITQKYQ